MTHMSGFEIRACQHGELRKAFHHPNAPKQYRETCIANGDIGMVSFFSIFARLLFGCTEATFLQLLLYKKGGKENREHSLRLNQHFLLI